jgi:hypothetical protein
MIFASFIPLTPSFASHNHPYPSRSLPFPLTFSHPPAPTTPLPPPGRGGARSPTRCGLDARARNPFPLRSGRHYRLDRVSSERSHRGGDAAARQQGRHPRSKKGGAIHPGRDEVLLSDPPTPCPAAASRPPRPQPAWPAFSFAATSSEEGSKGQVAAALLSLNGIRHLFSFSLFAPLALPPSLLLSICIIS